MWRKLWQDWVFPLLSAFVIYLLIRNYVAEPRIIPSSSMEPTLQIRDRVLVDKIYYRFNELERGDVVVFWPPEGVSKKYPFIKRVIGLPGDTVQVSARTLYVNGNPVQETYIPEEMLGDFGPVTVPEHKLFVMGDNRNESMDSRSWGFADLSKVMGRANWIIWPLSRLGKITKST